MMKMTWLKFGPARAQTKTQKNLYFPCAFGTVAHLLASAALHMAFALCAPLAKICKKTNNLIVFCQFPQFRFEAP